MLIIIFVIILLIGLFCKTSKNYPYFLILFFSFLSSISQDKADYYIYENVYNAIAKGYRHTDTGMGWYYLCKLGSKFDLTYSGFSFVVFLICFILIIKTLSRYENDLRFAIALYAIYPMMLDVIQIRYFLASSIFIFSFGFLSEKRFKNMVLYILGILLATTFHQSCIVYLIFVVVPFFSKKIFKIMLGVMMLGAYIFIRFKDNFVSIAMKYFSISRIKIYLESGNISSAAIACYSLFFIATFAMVVWVRKRSGTENEELKLYADMMYKANLLILLTLPLVYFSSDFLRLQRNLWTLNTILFSKYARCGKGIEVSMRRRLLCILFYGTAFAIFIVWLNYDGIVKALFTFEGVPKFFEWR